MDGSGDRGWAVPADDVRATTAAGVAATHPSSAERVIYVAPTDAGDHNTVRLGLAPVACWSVGDDRFEFDTSFVKPGLADELIALQRLLGGRHLPMTVFGHTDPVGDDDYNKALSGRRATAIYALLTRRVDLWERLYAQPFGGDRWGLKAIQEMLRAIADPASHAQLYTGPVNGAPSKPFSDAVRAFQAGAGLVPDGDPGPATRAALFLAYMDVVCKGEDGAPFNLDPAVDFLARGADPGGKGDYQGCSELNPVLVFSKAEAAELSAPGEKSRRDRENTPNRRVTAFLFREGTVTSAGAWPCPRSSEGIADCRKRLWSDGDTRRAPSEERRTFAQHRDTFACRFYQRMAHDSPCEGVIGPSRRTPFHLSLSLRSNSGRLTLAHQPFRIYLADGGVFEGETDAEGNLLVDDVPADDYLLEVDGARTLVPATFKETGPRITRVPGHYPVK